jgi:hypothetical protein
MGSFGSRFIFVERKIFGQVKKRIDYGLSKVGQSAILDRACCGSISFAKFSQTLLYINYLFLRDFARFVKIFRDLK